MMGELKRYRPMSDNSVADIALYTQAAGYLYILTPNIMWENAGRRDEMSPVAYSAVGSIPFSRPALTDKSQDHSICLTLTNTNPLVRGNCGRRSGCFVRALHLTTCVPNDDNMFVNQSGLLSQDQGTYHNQICVPMVCACPCPAELRRGKCCHYTPSDPGDYSICTSTFIISAPLGRRVKEGYRRRPAKGEPCLTPRRALWLSPRGTKAFKVYKTLSIYKEIYGAEALRSDQK